eukprot:TRINITY_DN80158_c0_g1_i1.p1 TRINITY_DN80158_c0_g1~~TRINITY_DN80158_c0_g1_i1.p1  ORF type:complete len:551 (-),score=56.36 TRINITY_DN80158_c0_g1_i1:61-1713(-)
MCFRGAWLISSGLAVVVSSVGGAEPCSVLEHIAKHLQCLGLEADKEGHSAASCSSRCCGDSACEVWQFNPNYGCYRGQSYSCVETGSLFVLGAVGARIRGSAEAQDATKTNLAKYNALANIEPYSDAAVESYRLADPEDNHFLLRRRGPSLRDFDVLARCWGPRRRPENCCKTSICFPPGSRNEEFCCPNGEPASDDMVVLISDRFSDAERKYWDSLAPRSAWDDEAWQLKRLRWRFGTHPAHESCSSQLRVTSMASAQHGEADAAGLHDVVWLLQAAGITMSRTFINVGAGTCVPPDPLYELLHAAEGTGFQGLAVEGDAGQLAQCTKATANSTGQYIPVNVVLEPASAAATLKPFLDHVFSSPERRALVESGKYLLDVMVVDIDGADCLITEELLEVVQPKLLLLEIVFHIPPPFRFAAHHDAAFHDSWHTAYDVSRLNPVAGCSLSYAIHRLARFDMYLLKLTDNDALFLHQSVAWAFEQSLGVRFPQDEFQCYRASRLWLQMPPEYVRDWFFTSAHPAEDLGAIWGNLSWVGQHARQRLSAFTLDY